MLLINKKTGEIAKIAELSGTGLSLRNEATGQIIFVDSISKLNEEWEDYEEPKEYWYVDWIPEIGVYHTRGDDTDVDKRLKEIGNYFETREEAEKAVEKLKAWKRLKDKGAEFYGWRRNQTGTYELYLRWEDRIPRSYEIKNDLDLLFGGDE